MDTLTDLSKAQLRVILSYVCYSDKKHDDVISIFRALRDNLIANMNPVIEAKYNKFLEQQDLNELMNYVGTDRRKAICMMFAHILSKSIIKAEMLDTILNCLNVCNAQIEGTDELIEQLYAKIIHFCKSNKDTHDYIMLTERWMKVDDETWKKMDIDAMLIPAKPKKPGKSKSSNSKSK
jgi:hypothetical protein